MHRISSDRHTETPSMIQCKTLTIRAGNSVGSPGNPITFSAQEVSISSGEGGTHIAGVGALHEQQLTTLESTSTGETNLANLNLQINSLEARNVVIANSNALNGSDMSSPVAYVDSRMVNTEFGTISGNSYLQNSTLFNSGNISGPITAFQTSTLQNNNGGQFTGRVLAADRSRVENHGDIQGPTTTVMQNSILVNHEDGTMNSRPLVQESVFHNMGTITCTSSSYTGSGSGNSSVNTLTTLSSPSGNNSITTVDNDQTN